MSLYPLAGFRRSLLILAASAPGLQAQPPTGLAGTVRDTSGAAVALAQLFLSGVKTTSDSAGRYHFAALPSGAATLSVRRIGFAPLDAHIDLIAGRTDSLHVILVMVPGVLPGVITEAETIERIRLSDFYRHREVGNGFFFNRKELEAKKVVRISDVLRRLPGVRLVPERSGRTQIRMARSNCTPDFWIDGQRAPFLNVDDMPLGDVEAIEVYRGAAGIPPEFNNRLGNPGCGAVVIWTRLPG